MYNDIILTNSKISTFVTRISKFNWSRDKKASLIKAVASITWMKQWNVADEQNKVKNIGIIENMRRQLRTENVNRKQDCFSELKSKMLN